MGCATSHAAVHQSAQLVPSPRPSDPVVTEGAAIDRSNPSAKNALTLDLSAHSHFFARDLPLHKDQRKLLEEADELADAGECEEALKTYKLALRIAAAKAEDTPEGSLGVALYLEKLAACHVRMKDGDKAIALLHRLVQVREKGLGMSHVDTLAAVHQMATCLTMQQMYDSAVPLFTRILRAEEEAGHGPESSQVIAASAHLGICLFKAGRADDALPLLQGAVQGRTTALGPSHSDTLASQQALAQCLLRLGRYAEAEPLLRQLVDELTQSPEFGCRHADTLQCADSLAHCLAQMGEHKKSVLLLSQSLKQRQEALGPVHPATAKSRKGLITMLTDQDAYEEALPLLREALEVARMQQGARGVSPDEALNNIAAAAAALAKCLLALQQWEEAAQLFQEAVGVGEELYGDVAAADPDVLRWMAGLAEALEQLPGRRQEALGLWQKASQGCAAMLGAQHADTQRYQQRHAALQQLVEAGGDERPSKQSAQAKAIVEPEPERSHVANGGAEAEAETKAEAGRVEAPTDEVQAEGGDGETTVQVLMGEGGQAVERGGAGQEDEGRWASTAEPGELAKAKSLEQLPDAVEGVQQEQSQDVDAVQAAGQQAQEADSKAGDAAAADGVAEVAVAWAAAEVSGDKDAVTLLVDGRHKEVVGMASADAAQGTWAAATKGEPKLSTLSMPGEGEAALQVQDA